MSERLLEGKVALVTGASRGRGKGIALVLGEHGATVYVTGRSVRAKSGGVFTTPALAREYGFTDIDGKQQSAFWDEHWAGTWGV
jgi:NAD(P)-dependent dehydrogenase (short-subunit alcohol dehydrogenase family)